ncbi:hypothetical protein SFC07_04050 [Corynebacterium callunae]
MTYISIKWKSSDINPDSPAVLSLIQKEKQQGLSSKITCPTLGLKPSF